MSGLSKIKTLLPTKPWCWLGLLCVAACTTATTPKVARSTEAVVPRSLDGPALYANFAPAVVQVRAIWKEEGTTTLGSGSAIHLGGGRFLTACHILRFGEDDTTAATRVSIVVGRMDEATGTIQDDYSLPAKVVRCDMEYDLAILRPTRGKLPVSSVTLAGADPRPGNPAVALGAADKGFPWTFAACSIGALGVVGRNSMARISSVHYKQELDNTGGDFKRLVVQVGCDAHPMSGSALLNVAGELTGIMQFKVYDSSKERPNQWRFFVPASQIRAFLAE